MTRAPTAFAWFARQTFVVTMSEVERRQCPKEFQDRLTKAAGVNPFGGPNFVIEWGQTSTYTAGGVWPHDHFFGYRQLMKSNSSPGGRGVPCWMILEWHPADDYETDAVYYFRNRCETTGLQTLGEYPYSGRYEVAFQLHTKELLNGRLQLVYYHLDSMILDILIPTLIEGQRMSQRERLRRIRSEEEKRDRDMDSQIADMHHAAKRRILPSQIDDRVRLIQSQMGQYLKAFGRIQPGFKQNSITA